MENYIKQHVSSYDAMETFKQVLKEAQKDEDSWMVALWRVTGNGTERRIELKQVNTFKFPFGDFLSAVGQLSLHLFGLTKQSTNTVPDKLPPADFFKREDFLKDGGNNNE